MKNDSTNFFSTTLMYWHQHQNKREMPWKGIKDPYKIWLSEIILQQTRVDQGLKYYEKFVAQYATIFKLAAAKDEDVFKLWEGLGYYNRCKNLLFTARLIVNEMNGIFPTTYNDLLGLKGVGSYTAAAIASFAYNQPYAVVDGNVFRVLARFFGNATATDTAHGKQLFTQLANEVLDKKEPGQFNQAIMDFGATICKPALPNCSTCVLNKKCIAFANGLVNKLPIKEKTVHKKNRWLSYFLFEHKQQVLIKKRKENDIWQNLHEFYLVETDEVVVWNEALVQQFLHEQLNIKNVSIQLISRVFNQQLTHQKIKGQFIKVVLSTIPKALKNNQWLSVNEVNQLAFPKFINQFLEEKETQGLLF